VHADPARDQLAGDRQGALRRHLRVERPDEAVLEDHVRQNVRVFDHLEIRVSDREASRRFYELGLETLGIRLTYSDAQFDAWNEFLILQASELRPLTRRLHVAFAAPDRGKVDAFWQVLTAAGYEDDGAPGPRPQYNESYYGAFMLDPDGNSAEAAHHQRTRTDGGTIDHLWLRAHDVAESKRFYETIAPVVGLRLVHDAPDRVRFAGEQGSFTFVAGDLPTENVHLAFPALAAATVDEFHRAALAAGFRDNGAPGERPEYHAGYYGAFVLDPDGNNVEAVFHNR